MSAGLVFLFGVLGSILGGMFAFGLTHYFRRSRRYTPANAHELLFHSRPEEWNEVRILNPDWIPNLRKAKLSGTSLPLVNLQSAQLDEADLSRSNLEGAVLDRASLVGSDLSEANLTGASLRHVDLRKARLEGTRLEGVVLEGVRTDEQKLKRLEVPVISPTTSVEVLRQGHLDVDDVAALTPSELEELVARLLEEAGYEVQLASTTRDMGYDLIARRSDPLFGQDSFLVQIKKYAPDRVVSLAPVRALLGAMLEGNTHKGLFITTGRFSREATRLPQGLASIRMVDGETLIQWLRAGRLTSSGASNN